MGGQFETMYPGSQELIWTRILLIRCSSKVFDNKHVSIIKTSSQHYTERKTTFHSTFSSLPGRIDAPKTKPSQLN